MESADLFNLLIYISYLGVLILIGKFLRVKIKLFQRLYLPASLIGGFVGLILGPYMIGFIPQEITSVWGMLPGRLIDIVFACIFIGTTLPKPKEVWEIAGPQLTYAWILDAFQWILGIGLALFVLKPIWNIDPVIGTIVEVGWCGGHGTAGGMMEVYNSIGFTDGGDLALTSATVGMISGIIFGIVLINMAVRKNYCKILESPDQIDFDDLSGILPEDEEKVIAKSVITSSSVEPFAFHASLIGISIIIGSFMQTGLKMIHPKLSGVPLFPLTMIGGLIVQSIFNTTGKQHIVNRQIIERLQGLALDFLVVGAVASIKIPIVVKYALPLLILMCSALAMMVFLTWFLAPRFFQDDVWFERAIAEFGAQTGVLAVGLLLLRVVDPDFETNAPKAFAFERPFFSPFVGGGLITSVIPLMINEMGALKVILIWIGILLALFGVAFANKWIGKHPGPYKRAGAGNE